MDATLTEQPDHLFTLRFADGIEAIDMTLDTARRFAEWVELRNPKQSGHPCRTRGSNVARVGAWELQSNQSGERGWIFETKAN